MTLTKLSTTLLVCCILTGTASAQTKPPSADEVIQEAKAEAAKTHKNIFIIFHASWCVWCHRMDTAMNDKKIKSFFDKNYVIRHLTVDESQDKKDLENPGAAALRTQYHGDKQGIPYWLIFDKNGNLLADSRYVDENGKEGSNVGCPAEPQEVDYFIGVLKKTSTVDAGLLPLVHERFLLTKN
jgi:thioredoxin-related protein